MGWRKPGRYQTLLEHRVFGAVYHGIAAVVSAGVLYGCLVVGGSMKVIQTVKRLVVRGYNGR